MAYQINFKKTTNILKKNGIKLNREEFMLIHTYKPMNYQLLETHLALYDTIDGIRKKRIRFEEMKELNHIEFNLRNYHDMDDWYSEAKYRAIKGRLTVLVKETGEIEKVVDMDYEMKCENRQLQFETKSGKVYNLSEVQVNEFTGIVDIYGKQIFTNHVVKALGRKEKYIVTVYDGLFALCEVVDLCGGIHLTYSALHFAAFNEYLELIEDEGVKQEYEYRAKFYQ